MERRTVAVVGAGPAGFFAAQELLEQTEPTIAVDLFDRMPTPTGLVRNGVAPDHPRIKSVSATFDRIAGHPRFRFFGNVELGRHISREDLLCRYDAVLYAMGAQTERRLGIPGEHLPGVHSALSFVGWYNGHPDHRDLRVDLTSPRAVVVGNGNVALDVARILMTPPVSLARTDIADHALALLTRSRIQEVVVVGRRGPGQAAFTAPAVDELGSLTGATVTVEPAGVMHRHEELLSSPGARTLAALTRCATPVPERDPARRIRLLFLRSPVELRGEGRLEQVELATNQLAPTGSGAVAAFDTGERESLAAGLLVGAVGYRASPLAGLPQDPDSGTVRNHLGRVTGRPREYVTGWIKRGPSGIIGTNKKCAVETVGSLAADLAGHDSGHGGAPPDPGWPETGDLVTWAGWTRIDEFERELGARAGRPRVKVTDVSQLLDLAARRSAWSA